MPANNSKTGKLAILAIFAVVILLGFVSGIGAYIFQEYLNASGNLYLIAVPTITTISTILFFISIKSHNKKVSFALSVIMALAISVFGTITFSGEANVKAQLIKRIELRENVLNEIATSSTKKADILKQLQSLKTEFKGIYYTEFSENPQLFQQSIDQLSYDLNIIIQEFDNSKVFKTEDTTFLIFNKLVTVLSFILIIVFLNVVRSMAGPKTKTQYSGMGYR